MNEFSPAEIYKKQTGIYEAELNDLQKKRSRLGWARLLVFMIASIVAYQVFVAAGIIGLVVVVTGIGILLWLVSVDTANNHRITNTQTLIRINQDEIKSLEDDYSARYDGKIYQNLKHDYANDLDLFGSYSVFQWMNRCYTEQGRDLLANDLLQPLSLQQIRKRHEAMNEIVSLVDWRQQLQAFSMQKEITRATENKTKAWLIQKDQHFVHPAWKFIVPIYSLLTLLSAAAAFTGYIPISAFGFLFTLYFLVANGLSRKTVKTYAQLSGIVKEIGAIQQLVEWIENYSFDSTLINDLQNKAKGQNKKASVEIKELKNILDRFDLRLNFAGPLFFNSFLLWDVRQMMLLNKWKIKNKNLVANWFEMIAEIELINSLATIRFNYPEWAVPEFSNTEFTLKTEISGHPLIPKNQRVHNDFFIEGKPKIGLITGSNMAGKSTFLRSLGVNIVLAQMGAPVCAKTFLLSPVRLISSMRIADNLAENTSTFYAELKKLKTIIEAVNRHEPVFILLDEILRGTNSLDRHSGSEALIGQLIRQKAVAAIASHDVELAKLQQSFPGSIENYHFDVQVEGEELYFDYKLKEGVCTSMNASILMKKIGIELTE